MTRPLLTIRSLAAVASFGLLAGCATGVPAPEWKANAQDALLLMTTASLSGDEQVERYEFARAYDGVAQTGRGDLLARVELARCATRVASLVFEPCAGYERLRDEAAPPERAYAAFLAGTLATPDIALLPAQYHAVAAANSDAAGLSALRGIDDPLSRLIAAAVLVHSARASSEVLTLAADTASAQGWRRPLLAWLGAQALAAERSGNTDQAKRLRRRMALVTGN